MITIFSTGEADRRYATRFVEDVYDAVFATVQEPAGKGLLVIGQKTEPHPVSIIRRHYDQIPPLEARYQRFLDVIVREFDAAAAEVNEKLGVGLDEVIILLPVEMQTPVYELFMLAREEDFDSERIKKRLDQINGRELLREGLFENYDWVIFLSEPEAFAAVAKEVIPTALKAQSFGFLKRAFIRAALPLAKPILRDALEAQRKATLYNIILKSIGSFQDADRRRLVDAYKAALEPEISLLPGAKRKRGRRAIRRQLEENRNAASRAE